MISIEVKQLPHAADLPLPEYQSEGAAGMDIMAAIETPVSLAPMQRALIATGLQFALPVGYEAQMRPRSGLALKHGITVLNSPGTIDSDFRGEVAVLLINLGSETFEVSRGMRIAQLVIAPAARAFLTKVEILSATGRGSGGFGSTGTTS